MTMFTQHETRILDQARDIISRYYQRGVQLCSPDDVRRCVMVELAPLEHEESASSCSITRISCCTVKYCSGAH